MIAFQNEQLTTALSKVVKAANGRDVPIRGNVLISVIDNVATLTCGNGELQLQATLNCSGDLSVTVDAKKLHAICANSTADIKLELKEQKLIVKSGRSRSTLSTLPVSDFPLMDDVVGEVTGITVGVEALKAVSHAMGKQDVRFYLNGMLIQRVSGMASIVATDGHRLAVSESEQAGDDCAAIIPRSSVASIIAMAGDESMISICDKSAVVKSDGLTLITKLIDGKFPSWRRVIPITNHQTQVSKSDFMGALVDVSITAHEKYKGVDLTLTDDGLELSSFNPNNEATASVIDAANDGTFDAKFNGLYLADAAKSLGGELIDLKYSDGRSLLMTGTSGVICVITGMRR